MMGDFTQAPFSSGSQRFLASDHLIEENSGLWCTATVKRTDGVFNNRGQLVRSAENNEDDLHERCTRQVLKSGR